MDFDKFMKRALLSLTDKTGVTGFAQRLVSLGFELVSTGGTASTLRSAGLPVTDVSTVTGFPETLDGRVKTLHPKVHGGILGDARSSEHRQAMADLDIQPIHVVAVNLYAFERTVTQEHEFEEAVESIDIGGPAMLRAAAKNHANVYVIVDPFDYERVLVALEQSDNSDLKRELAAKAFRHTAFYDSMIARYFTNLTSADPYSETLTLGLRRANPFRYGENPHQRGALYLDPLGSPGLASAKQVWGLDLGYNNWNDADGAWELVADLPETSCAITKHGNPCGAATSTSFAQAFEVARLADPISAFGGVVAINGELDEEAATAMTAKGNKLDVIIATGFTPGALRMFQDRKGWGQEVRLLEAELPRPESTLTVKSIRGGWLVQDSDEDPDHNWQVVTDKAPTGEQCDGLKYLWRIIPHVKSNAIIVGRNGVLQGVGAGQMNRVQSVRLSLDQAGADAQGACLASDAFFPFPDSIEVAARAGIAAIVQPGGSKKDQDVIDKANELGIAMVLTGVRHFRH
jgi:phosphoribosylaminoimidazolecarboxamide formyltransferase/IMP cyclohydrolase